jgi:adenosylhomocysteine nucleosidase
MPHAVILISAGAEWRIVRDFYPDALIQQSPFGEYFEYILDGRSLVFFHGGWGKISAAATAQFAIDHWHAPLLINLGTCGGFAGQIERGTILLVRRTVVYDIIEQMGDPQEAIDHYSSDLDLAFLRQPYPQPVQPALLVSADRDICPEDIPMLIERFQATAADWESGAIAWVARCNRVPCLILRGVSDLVSADGGEAYQAIEVFHQGTRQVMETLLKALPAWLERCI